jgi:hypothetical protein
MRGLAKSPADRPESAAAFREALLRCNVPPWTESDARAWWQAYASFESEPDAAAPEITTPSSEASTIAVVRSPAASERESM